MSAESILARLGLTPDKVRSLVPKTAPLPEPEPLTYKEKLHEAFRYRSRGFIQTPAQMRQAAAYLARPPEKEKATKTEVAGWLRHCALRIEGGDTPMMLHEWLDKRRNHYRVLAKQKERSKCRYAVIEWLNETADLVEKGEPHNSLTACMRAKGHPSNYCHQIYKIARDKLGLKKPPKKETKKYRPRKPKAA
jgi:hypothetical protein